MKTVAIIMSLLTAVPVNAIAQEPTVAIIHKGSVVPFDGVLFDNLAYATEKANKEQAEKLCKDTIKLELGLQAAKLNFTTSTTAIALSAEKQKNIDIMKVKDKSIDSLTDQLLKAQEKSSAPITEIIVWSSVGMSIGVVLGLGIMAILKTSAGSSIVTVR